MRPAAPRSPDRGQRALGGRVERDIIGVLLGLMGLSVAWWGGSWWWRAACAEVAPAPLPAALDTALPPGPSRSERRRTLALVVASPPAPAADAGVGEGVASGVLAAPAPRSYGLDLGHGSESWSRSDAPGRQDFEPRYTPDGGTFAEPAPVTAEAPVFH